MRVVSTNGLREIDWPVLQVVSFVCTEKINKEMCDTTEISDLIGICGGVSCQKVLFFLPLAKIGFIRS